MKTREFKPKDGLLRLPNYVIRDLQKHGHAFMTLPNGNVQKITMKDLLFKKDEIDRFTELKKIGKAK